MRCCTAIMRLLRRNNALVAPEAPVVPMIMRAVRAVVRCAHQRVCARSARVYLIREAVARVLVCVRACVRACCVKAGQRDAWKGRRPAVGGPEPFPEGQTSARCKSRRKTPPRSPAACFKSRQKMPAHSICPQRTSVSRRCRCFVGCRYPRPLMLHARTCTGGECSSCMHARDPHCAATPPAHLAASAHEGVDHLEERRARAADDPVGRVIAVRPR